MSGKDPASKCAVVIIADGFSEVETIGMLCTLRKAGINTKSVGLTSGLIKGEHGILVMPDLTMVELPKALSIATISLAVLPGGDRHLSRLEQDPRVHRLIRDVVAAKGVIATNPDGVRVLDAGFGGEQSEKSVGEDSFLLRYALNQPIELFAQDLVRRLG